MITMQVLSLLMQMIITGALLGEKSWLSACDFSYLGQCCKSTASTIQRIVASVQDSRDIHIAQILERLLFAGVTFTLERVLQLLPSPRLETHCPLTLLLVSRYGSSVLRHVVNATNPAGTPLSWKNTLHDGMQRDPLGFGPWMPTKFKYQMNPNDFKKCRLQLEQQGFDKQTETVALALLVLSTPYFYKRCNYICLLVCRAFEHASEFKSNKCLLEFVMYTLMPGFANQLLNTTKNERLKTICRSSIRHHISIYDVADSIDHRPQLFAFINVVVIMRYPHLKEISDISSVDAPRTIPRSPDCPCIFCRNNRLKAVNKK